MNTLQPGPYAWDGSDCNTQLYSIVQNNVGKQMKKHIQKNRAYPHTGSILLNVRSEQILKFY